MAGCSPSPTAAFARGHEARVPLIIGSNSWEASLLPPSGYAGYLAAATPETKAAYAERDRPSDAICSVLACSLTPPWVRQPDGSLPNSP